MRHSIFTTELSPLKFQKNTCQILLDNVGIILSRFTLPDRVIVGYDSLIHDLDLEEKYRQILF